MIPTSKYMGGRFVARRRTRRWYVAFYWGFLVPATGFMVRLYRPEPDESEFRNDERETHQRDRAHFLAYAPLSLGLCLLLPASDWSLHTPKPLAWIPMEQELLVPGLIQVLLVMFLTLPQAILLWTEPDMEEAR
jgi:hypothetical protein